MKIVINVVPKNMEPPYLETLMKFVEAAVDATDTRDEDILLGFDLASARQEGDGGTTRLDETAWRITIGVGRERGRFPGHAALKSVAHEMTHVRQMLDRRLAIAPDGTVTWEGNVQEEDFSECRAPWEREAYDNELPLLDRMLEIAGEDTHGSKV